MSKNIKLTMLAVVVAALGVNRAFAYEGSAVETWVDGKLVATFDGNSTKGAIGTITFDPWGFTGPGPGGNLPGGRTADDFSPINGFGNGVYISPSDPACIADPVACTAAACIADPASCGIGQVQHVVTQAGDGYTQDPPHDINFDFFSNYGPYPRANVDSLATFYFWGYTSPAGSTFNNMLIDIDGDYQVAREDMTFEWYNVIDYTQVVPDGEARIGGYNKVGDYVIVPDGPYANDLAFQPYPLSDARGWCGSVLAQHPNAHEAMAGQVQFDFAFDVYLRNSATGTYSYMSTEIVNNFKMRSYGSIAIDITTNWGAGDQQLQYATAVVNNTDPRDVISSVDINTPVGTGPEWHNRVSFMGADVLTSGSDASGNTGDCGIPNPAWSFANSGPGTTRYLGLIKGVPDQPTCEAQGGAWQTHAFATYAFILRADAERIIDYFDEAEYGPDPMLADTDGDGLKDIFYDNCTLIPNPDQLDTDGDGYGNICDADFNGDNIVNAQDLGLFKSAFFTTGNVAEDLNGDGIVNSLDLGLFKARFMQPPGPSGTTGVVQ